MPDKVRRLAVDVVNCLINQMRPRNEGRAPLPRTERPAKKESGSAVIIAQRGEDCKVTLDEIIARAIAKARESTEAINRAIALLELIRAAVPTDDETIGTPDIWSDDGVTLHIHPAIGREGHEVAALLARHMGMVFKREIHEQYGTLYYVAVHEGTRVVVYGRSDPTCQIVQVPEAVTAIRYKLRCPSAGEAQAPAEAE